MRDRYGPPDVVQVREVDRPGPTGDEVLVRVRAASVNRADLDMLYPRWQFTRLFYGLRRPRVRRIGLDVAGVVEAVGPTAVGLRPGDEVFADLFSFGQGAFAEYVCAPARAFATMPAGSTFEEAATLPHSAILAIQGLRLPDGRSVKQGDRVLIDGASGNVGPFAVQLAKAKGAHVTGVCSAAKMDLVRSLGADRVIDYASLDYTTLDYATANERYDWILASDARHPIHRYRGALRRGGVFVALGATTSWLFASLVSGPVVSAASGRRMGLMLWWKPFPPDDVALLKDLVTTGQLRPVIDRTFPLSEVVEALRHVDDGHARGKVVVTV